MVPNLLRRLQISEGSLVDKGANPLAMVSLFKRAGNDVTKAKWTVAYINDLPDSAFAYIGSGGEKDEDGKTTPRALRHLPYKDAEGNIDAAHVRNALARLPQTDIPEAARAAARRKLIAAAEAAGIEVAEDETMMKGGGSVSLIDRVKRFFKMDYKPMTFDAAMAQTALDNDWWRLTDALRTSIRSIMESDAENKGAMVQMSLVQFTTKVLDLFEQVQHELPMLKSSDGPGRALADLSALADEFAKGAEMQPLVDRVYAALDVLQPVLKSLKAPPADPTVKKGDDTHMPVTVEDVLKAMKPEDRAVVEAAIAKREPDPNVAQQIADLQKAAEKVTDLEKRAAEAETKLTKAEEALAAEREIRVGREYLEKAAKFPHAGTPEEVAAMLRKADEAGIGESLIKSLTAQHEAISKGALFSEIGKAGGKPSAGPEADLDKMALDVVAKSAGSMTYEQAYTEVLKTADGKRLFAQLDSDGGAH